MAIKIGTAMDSLRNRVAAIRLGILGDSISDNTAPPDWPNNIPPQYVVNNHSVSGWRILWHLDLEVAAAAGDDNDIIIIALGVNDDNDGDMGVLQAEVEENIIELKASNTNATIYYMNVLPCWIGGVVYEHGNIRTAIAAACTAQGIDCWDTFGEGWIIESDTADGVHPTLAGGVKIWNEIAAKLAP